MESKPSFTSRTLTRRGSYAPPKIEPKNDDLSQFANSQTSSQEEERSIHPRRRIKRSVTFIMDRDEMSVEQRQVYDLTSLQVKLVESFPNYVRQAEDFTFIRMIGKGAFGYVWVANDLKTGNVVAIKELHRIDGKKQSPLIKFIREVQTMIKVKSRFTLPIYGFTAEPPFSIIMPLMTENTLNDLLQKKQYTFTNLNIYAICIARGLRDIHKAGIVYRDLKATNILMDHDGIPIICDFGTAKMYTENARMTLKAGTFCFMAPEVYNNPYYDQKCDIHSYGSLLYELSELAIPLKKMDDDERLDFMLSGKIPEFHKDRTPKPLRKLITRCWDLDPKNRPEWDEIIELFETGKVYFRTTNILKVKHFASKIKTELENFHPFNPVPSTNHEQLLDELHDHLFKNRLFKNILGQEKINDLIIFQKPTVSNQTDLGSDFKISSAKILDIPQDNNTNSTDDEVEKIERKIDNDDNEEDNDTDSILDENTQKLTPLIILKNPDMPEFPVYLDFLSKELQPHHFIDFYQGTLPYIRGFWDCPQIALVFHCYESIVRRNQQFLDLCISSNFFNMISKKTLHYSMGMVSLFVHYRPQLIDDSEKNLIIDLLENDPYETIYIFGEAANNHMRIIKLIPLFDALLNKYQLFFEHQTGEIFLGIFYKLYTKSIIYKNARSEEMKNLFVNFLDTESSIHKLTAINAICNIYDPSIQLSFNNIMELYTNCSHINVRNSCISLLMRMKNYPVSKKFCNTIINEIPENINAFYVLLQFASEGYKQSKMLIKNPKWMSEYITINNANQQQHMQKLIWFALQLFMLICLNNKIRRKVAKMDEFPGFIKKLFLLESRTAFVALNAALKKMSLNQSFINKIADEGVFDLFIKQAQDPKMAAISIMTLQTFIAHGYSDKYELLIPMSNAVLTGQNFDIMAKKAALQFLCVLASLKNMPEKILSCHELMQFAKNDSTPELAKYIRSFNQAISKK